MRAGRCAMLILALAASLPAFAQAPVTLQQRVMQSLAAASPGTRFGLLVMDEAGRELVAINPDQRFIPASNTKMFTTAVAFWALPDLDQPDATGGAAVRLEQADVVLEGHGDARLSGAADCVSDCLAALADAVAAKTRRVRNVIGDDTLYPFERWGPGMSWNNIPTNSGTATSALTIDDNELEMLVTPAAPGAPPKAELAAPYYEIDNRAVTVSAGGETAIGYDRDPDSKLLFITGTIAADAKPERFSLGIDDPAHYAAWQLRRLLEARGVRVSGDILVRHRRPMPSDDPEVRKGAPVIQPQQQEALARLTPPPLAEDLKIINKVSQNLHAELMLRRVSVQQGSGSIADGLAVMKAMLEQAGVPRLAYDFSDGSGMSSYNRVAPRGAVALLRWIAAQPWGAQWRETLPIAGTDGTLARRFVGTPLAGKLFAKTGTLNATNALSGYMIAKSGRTLTFSLYANDVPQDAGATKAMDAALVTIAAEN